MCSANCAASRVLVDQRQRAMAVAGLLIERVCGQSYEDFIRTRLTDKLGMTVGFTLNDLEASVDAARPYMMDEEERLPALRLPIRTIAGGAMNASVSDLARWMRLHIGKGEVGGKRLLPTELINELHASRIYHTLPGDPEFGKAHYRLGSRLGTIAVTVWLCTAVAGSGGAR
jgi:CubicO group peptidase (beta-lactamase class C family)